MFWTTPENLVKSQGNVKLGDLIRNIVAKVSSKEPIVVAVPVQKALIFPNLDNSDVGKNIAVVNGSCEACLRRQYQGAGG